MTYSLGPVLGSSPLDSLTLSGAAYSTGGLVSISDGYFLRAREVKTLTQPPNESDVQLSAPNIAAIQSGDLIALQFYCRMTATSGPGAKAWVRVVFEKGIATTTQSLNAAIAVDGQWSRHTYLFKAAEAYAAGQGVLRFNLGFAPQTIQITELRISNVGRPVVESPPLARYYSIGDAGVSVVPVSGQPFTQALRVTTRSRPADPWNAQFRPNPQVFTSDTFVSADVFCLAFRARSVSSTDPSGRATVTPIFERSTDYVKSLDQSIRLDNQWRQYVLPFKSSYAYSAGQVRLGFFIGYAPQTLEIADIRLFSFRQTISLNDLPRDAYFTYAGREPNAPWRAEAAARIQQHRKAELEVEVRDADGLPIPNATVRVAMTRHAFGLGSAINLQRLTDTRPEYIAYREEIVEMFNRVVNENDLKWPAWEGDWGSAHTKAKSIAGLKWLKDRDFFVRGHVMVWPSYNNVAKSAQALWDQPDRLREHVLWHIADLGTSTGMYCDEFDVVNEPYTNHEIMDMLGNEVMVDWYKKARDVMPNTRLFINDYSILATGGSTNTAHQQHYYDTIKFLLEKGAPLQGIGCQGHFSAGSVASPPVLWQILDRYSTFGLPIEITEFDIGTFDELADADFIRDFMTTVFAHPSVNGFVQWGFWERMHWKPECALFRADWSIKPNGVAYKKLVFQDWWTTAEGASDFLGRYHVQGKAFKGKYAISAAIAGTSVTLQGVQVLNDRTGSNTVVIQLAGVHATPTAFDDPNYRVSASAPEGLRINAPGVLANDRGFGALTAQLLEGPSHAAAFTLNADGSFQYRPTAGWTGTDTFRYKAAYGTLLSSSALVTIRVDPAISRADRWTPYQ